ncbi:MULTISPECIES: SDR family oxidoreductase [Streptomyces]|uniref:3-oxoacyl-ACP reductase n=1 Tax=Streptomyces spororaveus TaxID=284039 RepID=A0ABQ3T9Y5_9ACTN|nr:MULTISPECIES: SDR family oxidoreductase [Streptomyces]MCM9082788.1 SDR family oxidoreductase [Streptomyces spororaveus]MCX5302443.1 SDR family oxidoreductase [Streptomyces sp. NBC_00160]GHI76785.1 3-oxoacyl-ACP reductase [Streptomyces spororaveus]
MDGNSTVALVTGGSRGIGAAVALRLAEDGADVAITYVSDAEAAAEVVGKVEALGRRALAVRADAAEPGAAGAAVERVVAEFGRLDVLVNNAGVGVLGPLEALTPAEVDRVLEVNVRGVFHTTRAAAAHLGSGGRIITIGSCMTQRVPGPGGTLYAMSKSALIGFNRALARELGERGVTANIVHPGPVDTDMNPADGPYAGPQAALTALGRFGAPREVAAVVSFLAGEEAAYVTGAEFAVDGGHAA